MAAPHTSNLSQEIGTVSKITRKRFLEGIVSGCLASILPIRSDAEENSAGPLMIPYPAKPCRFA